ncbi:U1 small nuclear ribonucleoprotein 70 kDa-like [Pogonomyrmex barbatus]|uniref:U1 small nuclear ribonucleoprotein 70 kDa-like n=1 Tax=Pogonomyrmex barbatus TaxID=144034 RepID=A0A6I9WQZ3_9HYME|nr:U1 small nuclear ribonucleoprotein 70 kDa-like [Pogonomyrmex barbatus]XP_011644567.1 U1 small nuclear ribonucleoprotein 70 kDa-like [Pogonomyrmex barbatus]
MEETTKETEQKRDTEDDAENARIERTRRRDERRGICRCGERRSRSRRRRRRRRIISRNPFIIFFLEMYFQTPDKHVTEVARQAGKEWCAMREEDKMKYKRLAERERKRRGSTRRRRRGCP